MASLRQYIYVGDLLQVLGQKRTGIPRVEWEVARRLIADGAMPFAFSQRMGRFAHVADGALDFMNRLQDIEFEELLNGPSSGGHTASRAITRLLATAHPYMPHELGMHWHTERLLLRMFAGSFDAMSAGERHDILQRMGATRGSPLEGKILAGALRHRGAPIGHSMVAGPIEFERDAVVLNCGIWWNEPALAEMSRFRQALGSRYVGIIYDLSPIRRPGDFGEDLSASFRKFLDASLAHADALMPISSYVAGDLAAYAGEVSARLPRVTTLRLAPGITAGSSTTLSSRLARAGLQDRPFVPFVSTLNPRKGHRQAYELWVRVVEALGEKAPALVWAGHCGKPEGDARALASADSRMWGRHLHFIEAPTDAELAWLYANASYTLYPSTFEGWGLPITESLAFGKYCLAADNTSLPEAGEGLVFHAAADDTEAWLAEIKRLALEPGYLQATTARVVAGYRTRTWDDVARDVAHCVQAAAEQTDAAMPPVTPWLSADLGRAR